MYQTYWQLKDKPFENTPNPDYIFRSSQHEEALSRMLYVIHGKKGAAILTGEFGSGKTLLTRVLLRELQTEKYQIALVLNPMLSPAQLTKEIVYQLGGEMASSDTEADVFNRLNKLLFEINKNGKSTIIIVDEAQAIKNISSFEEFRLLLNFQLDDSGLVTLVLFGQPELREKLRKLPQLEQRVSLRYHLKALSETETKEYVLHRLKVAGGRPEIFSEDVFGDIYSYSRGIPRMINNICDLALLVGSGEKVEKIDKTLVKKIAEDLKGEEPDELEVNQAKAAEAKAAEDARAEAEAKLKAAEAARAVAEAKAKAAEEAKAAAEAKAQAAEEAKSAAKAQVKAKAATEARAAAEEARIAAKAAKEALKEARAIAKEGAEAEVKARAEVEARVREAEAKVKAEAEAKIKVADEARMVAEAKAKAEAEARAAVEAEALRQQKEYLRIERHRKEHLEMERNKEEAEAKAKAEAEARAREEAETKAREEAAAKVKAKTKAKAKKRKPAKKRHKHKKTRRGKR